MHASAILAILAAVAPALINAKKLGTPADGFVVLTFEDGMVTNATSTAASCALLPILPNHWTNSQYLEVKTSGVKCYFWSGLTCNNKDYDGETWCNDAAPFSLSYGTRHELTQRCNVHTRSFRCYKA